ncbi:MAG TPA: hypothetical protein PL193_01335 [Xanthobacteraceae bacterium]|nr:hypothetical protein [Xanthobacteraceae bacterium]
MARKYQTQKEAGVILAVCGVISGLLSTYVNIPGTELFGVPMLPALFFGIVLMLGIYSWESHNPIPMIIAFVGVAAGWWIAYKVAITLHDPQNRNLLIVLGLMSGFLGSTITAAALIIASEDFRENRAPLKTVIFGTLAGTLLYFVESGGFIHGLGILFVVWQGGMAYIIGRALAFRPLPNS